jgi:hypothetical protein
MDEQEADIFLPDTLMSRVAIYLPLAINPSGMGLLLHPEYHLLVYVWFSRLRLLEALGEGRSPFLSLLYCLSRDVFPRK